MATFIRYLVSIAMQMAWQRAGKGGAIPPMRMPFGKGKSLPIPIIGPWQMMAAMWVARQIWTVYGRQVKSKLQNTSHPLVHHVGDLLPDTPKSATTAAAKPASTPANTPITHPAPQYGTQPLSSTNDSGSGKLTPGSVLNSLRPTN